jgi:hypothetical protein
MVPDTETLEPTITPTPTNDQANANYSTLQQLDNAVGPLRQQGISIRAIAKQLNVSPDRVYSSTKRLAKQAAESYGVTISREAISTRIFNNAPKAIKQIEAILDNNKYKAADKLTAAKDILDRSGFAPVQKTANIHAIEDMDASSLRDLVHSLVTGLTYPVKNTPIIPLVDTNADNITVEKPVINTQPIDNTIDTTNSAT